MLLVDEYAQRMEFFYPFSPFPTTMNEVRVQTIQTVIDVEGREHAPRNPSLPDAGTDAEGHSYEQALFTLLEADPEFLKHRTITSLKTLGIHNLISSLAQIRNTHMASRQVLSAWFPAFRNQNRPVWVMSSSGVGLWMAPIAFSTGYT